MYMCALFAVVVLRSFAFSLCNKGVVSNVRSFLAAGAHVGCVAILHAPPDKCFGSARRHKFQDSSVEYVRPGP